MDKYLKIFKALGDKTRLRMVKMLAVKGELCVCEIRAVIDFSMPTISNHLKILSEAKLVTSRKKDKFVNYKLNNDLTDNDLTDNDLIKIFELIDNIEGDEIFEDDKLKTLKADRYKIC